MANVEQTKGILTEQQFKSSPYKNFMSYEDYVSKALKLGSAFTFQRALLMQNAEEKSTEIADSVKGWALEKEAKKDEAEANYYAALAQYEAMKKAQNAATQRLEYVTRSFGENSTQYNQAFKNYNFSAKTLFDADVDLGCARDKFNFANASAFKAYLTSRLA